MSNQSLELIDRLVSFPTVSSEPNSALLEFVHSYLFEQGVASQILWRPDRKKGNLWATIGPVDRPGVILSGHSDVVPVEGQAWSSDPFSLRHSQDRLYGRGACDMKGFLGIVLAMVPVMKRRTLKAPVHIAISHDEETGCLGISGIIEWIAQLPSRPALCIVGEPTEMKVVVGHKGERAYRVNVSGRTAHSSLAPKAVNAIEWGADLVTFLRSIGREWTELGPFDPDFDIPSSTLSTGLITGGTAVNIVPDQCMLAFEFRHLASVDPEDVVTRIGTYVDSEMLPKMRAIAPEANVVCETLYQCPVLAIDPTHPAVRFVQEITGHEDTAKVSFGTEAGFFQGEAGVPSVVCGPGSIDQAHKADEFLEISQVGACERMLTHLLDRLETEGLSWCR